jgi:hypothetical protein
MSGLIDLEGVKMLRRLQLKASISDYADHEGDRARDVADVLSTVKASNNVLEVISLEIVVSEDPPWTITRSQDWAAVGSQVGRLSVGRGLLLKVEIWAYGNATTPVSEDARRDLYTYLDNAFQEALASHIHVEYRSVHLM